MQSILLQQLQDSAQHSLLTTLDQHECVVDYKIQKI